MMIKSKVTILQTIQTIMINAARLLKIEDKVGTIKTGN